MRNIMFNKNNKKNRKRLYSTVALLKKIEAEVYLMLIFVIRSKPNYTTIVTEQG